MVDTLTLTLNSVNNELLTWLFLLLDNEIIFLFLILGLIWVLEKDNDKRVKIVVAVLLAFSVGMVLKSLIEIPRPCEELILKTECKNDYSFPSIHAIVAFTLALGFLDDKKYPMLILFALIVAFSRIYLGLHTFVDMAAALVLSPIIYELVDLSWKWNKK